MAGFAMEYKRLLGTILVVTAVLGPTLAILTGVDALIGVVYVGGWLVVAPVVAWLGDDLPFVKDRGADAVARKLGREFESGRSSAGDAGK